MPTLLALFAQDVPGLRIINLGGEMCPQALVDQWATPGRQMFNTYGPTEATVSASLAELHAGEPVTIGEALPNYGLLVIEVIEPEAIVDGRLSPLKLLPFGETGELCITGPGVAAGYLGRPELTAEKFLPNPWARNDCEARLYRTGDLARVELRADGQPQMQCLGRADDQVKVRGFRVELGEIEAVLAAQPGVGTTAVVLRPDAGMDQLLLGSNEFEQLTVHFDPGCLGREFFSYTLEDADGDASTANLAITVTAEAALPDQITLSHTLVAENSAVGTVIANLAAYAGSFSLFQIYGDGGTFALTEDAGGLFAIKQVFELFCIFADVTDCADRAYGIFEGLAHFFFANAT